MGQKTVRLAAEQGYRVEGNRVVRDMRQGWSERNIPRWVTMPTPIQVGATMILVSTRDVSAAAMREGRDTPEYWLTVDTPGGVPGNSRPAICRYHGWRGTTDDRELWAYGRRRILRIRTLRSGDVAVTVGPDLAPDEP